MPQVRTSQVRTAQVRTSQVRSIQTRITEVRMTQVRTSQFRAIQVRITQLRNRHDVVIVLINSNPTTRCLFGTVSLITRTPTTTKRKHIDSLGELNTATGVRSRT